MPTTESERRERPDPLRIALSIWSLSILLAVLVLSRRIAGAFETTPPGLLVAFATALLFTAGIIACALCRLRDKLRTLQPHANANAPSPPKDAPKTDPTLFRGEGRGEGAGLSARFDRFTNSFREQIQHSQLLPTLLSILPPLIFGFALTSSTSTQMSILTLAVATGTLVWHLPSLEFLPAEVTSDLDQETSFLEPAADLPNINSQLTRRIDEVAGCEYLEGTAIAQFAAGQKLAVVHIAFCPPTFGMPDVECEPLEDTDVRWKLNVVQPYGLRIDVTRRGELSEATDVPIAFFATAPIQTQNAA